MTVSVFESYAKSIPADRLDQYLWLVSDDDPAKVSAEQVAERVNRRRRQPHVIWNPVDGEAVVMGKPGDKNNLYAPTNPASDMMAILVVANKHTPFTGYKKALRMPLLALMTEWRDVPTGWPMGAPVEEGLQRVSLKPGSLGGHYSSEQIDSTYGSVGRIDTRRLR